MVNLEGAPPWLWFQPVRVIVFVSASLTSGNHVRKEGRNNVRDGFVEDLDTALFSTWGRFSGEILRQQWTFREPRIGKR